MSEAAGPGLLQDDRLRTATILARSEAGGCTCHTPDF